jgi:hypothetical protein
MSINAQSAATVGGDSACPSSSVGAIAGTRSHRLRGGSMADTRRPRAQSSACLCLNNAGPGGSILCPGAGSRFPNSLFRGLGLGWMDRAPWRDPSGSTAVLPSCDRVVFVVARGGNETLWIDRRGRQALLEISCCSRQLQRSEALQPPIRGPGADQVHENDRPLPAPRTVSTSSLGD